MTRDSPVLMKAIEKIIRLTGDLEGSIKFQEDQVEFNWPSGVSEGTQQYNTDKEIASIYENDFYVDYEHFPQN